MQPAPHGAVADARHQAAALSMPGHIGHAQARQRHAQRGRQLAGQRLDLNGELLGGKTRGRPGRARSSRPANRSLKKRLRHWLTASRRVSRRAAISSLSMPAAAIRIIFARMTLKYGNVYLADRRFNSSASAADSSISNGLFLGMSRLLHEDAATTPYAARNINKYTCWYL